MPFAYEKLKGLDRERLMGAIEPVLRAHGLTGVEAIWRTDQRGWVLYLTVERPDATEPGAGITLDVCTDVSRDLSAALDVADAIEGAYRLELGSPGVERRLYTVEDYARFSGQEAKIRVKQAISGEYILRGVLMGRDDEARILVDTETGLQAIEFDQIESGQLILDMAAMGLGRGKPRPGRRARSKAKPSSSQAAPEASAPRLDSRRMR